MRNVLSYLTCGLKKHSSTRADRVERVCRGRRVSALAADREGVRQMQTGNFPSTWGRGATGRSCRFSSPGFRMMMTGIDAPGWFFRKAIPPHQLLGGRVGLSQHNRDKNVIMPPPPFDFDTFLLRLTPFHVSFSFSLHW